MALRHVAYHSTISLYGAVDPATGASFCLALPFLNSRALHPWLDGFVATFPQSVHLLMRDNGVGHKAKAVRWPPNVLSVVLPPYRPELHPMERLWRARKDTLADIPVKTILALSDAMGSLIHHYAQAPLQSLRSVADFVQAVETLQKVLYV
jgi:transposase